jgi:release factor glutamine methyltransferase
MDTPYTNHLDFQDVYEPAEDTYLLMDAIEDDLPMLRLLKPSLCVEVGSGSGVVASAVCKALGTVMCFTTDINPAACSATKSTAEQHGVSSRLNTVCADLLEPMIHQLHGKVDVLIFNPPYVPTVSEEITSSKIARAWAGGNKGREVVDRLLPHVSSLLAAQGVFYLLLLQENNPEEVKELMARQNLLAKIIKSRRAGRESLMVMRISRTKL